MRACTTITRVAFEKYEIAEVRQAAGQAVMRVHLGKAVKRALGHTQPRPLVGGRTQNAEGAVRAARVEHECLRDMRYDTLEVPPNAAGVVALFVLDDCAEADGGQQSFAPLHWGLREESGRD